MIADNQIRQQIFRKIRRIPSNKLNDLNDYLSKLEQTTTDRATKILSFAGSWNIIDESAFDELTENLITNRNKNNRRFEEMTLVTNNENHFRRIAGLNIENWKLKMS